MKATVLTGGVGGAKFVLGLARSEIVDNLTAIVNTGDDFRHLALHVSPDIDTLLYTLSGRSNVEQGWGRANETWTFREAVRLLNGPDWFALGDGDLALHVLRSERLGRGERLSSIIADYGRAWSISTEILPMSDDMVATIVETDEGSLPFQRYIVERQCQPSVSEIRFEGATEARAAPGVVQAIHSADMVFIAPSNPYLSVDPLLAVADIKQAIQRTGAPVVAISPIVGGAAVKGPTGKIMAELCVPVSNETIARHDLGIVDALLIDSADSPPESLPSMAARTLMRTLEDRISVARAAVALGRSVRK